MKLRLRGLLPLTEDEEGQDRCGRQDHRAEIKARHDGAVDPTGGDGNEIRMHQRDEG